LTFSQRVCLTSILNQDLELFRPDEEDVKFSQTASTYLLHDVIPHPTSIFNY